MRVACRRASAGRPGPQRLALRDDHRPSRGFQAGSADLRCWSGPVEYALHQGSLRNSGSQAVRRLVRVVLQQLLKREQKNFRRLTLWFYCLASVNIFR